MPLARARVTVEGLEGDEQGHSKHRKLSRALSLLDVEIIEQLKQEGYRVAPGVLGENLTIRGLHGRPLAPGMRLRFSSGVVIELTEARKPCFVLDAVHTDLKKTTIGRIGWMASVVTEGWLSPGENIEILPVQTKSAPAEGADQT